MFSLEFINIGENLKYLYLDNIYNFGDRTASFFFQSYFVGEELFLIAAENQGCSGVRFRTSMANFAV